MHVSGICHAGYFYNILFYGNFCLVCKLSKKNRWNLNSFFVDVIFQVIRKSILWYFSVLISSHGLPTRAIILNHPVFKNHQTCMASLRMSSSGLSSPSVQQLTASLTYSIVGNSYELYKCGCLIKLLLTAEECDNSIKDA